MAINVKKVCERLSTILKPSPIGGITVEALKLIIATNGGEDSFGTSVSNSMLVPLVETFIYASKWPYEIDRSRGTTKIRGVVFKTDELAQLADALANGVQSDPQTADLIETLRGKVFTNEN